MALHCINDGVLTPKQLAEYGEPPGVCAQCADATRVHSSVGRTAWRP